MEVKIEIASKLIEPKHRAALDIMIKINNKIVASGTVPIIFTANDCLDIGNDLGSPLSLDYFDTAPF